MFEKFQDWSFLSPIKKKSNVNKNLKWFFYSGNHRNFFSKTENRWFYIHSISRISQLFCSPTSDCAIEFQTNSLVRATYVVGLVKVWRAIFQKWSYLIKLLFCFRVQGAGVFHSLKQNNQLFLFIFWLNYSEKLNTNI